MRRPVRIAARIALFALIGAAATVLVAWRIAWQDPKAQPKPTLSGKPRLVNWPTTVPSNWAPQAFTSRFTAPGRAMTLHASLGDGNRSMTYFAFGWPLPAMEFIRIGENHRHAYRWAWHTPRRIGRGSLDVHWPLRPIAIPFIADTVLYGVLAFALWNALGSVRSRVIRRRGGCDNCGYDVKGLDLCPECGAPSGLATNP